MFYGITLIILGLLAAPSLLLSRKPDAKEILDKITPYQGWIGLVFCVLGIWGIIQAVLNISILGSFPIWWLTWAGSSALQAALGFILGYGMINKLLLSKNEDAQEKGAELLAKLAPIEGKLGLIAVFLGIWVIVSSLLFR